MAKKRKTRSSEVEATKAPPEPQHEVAVEEPKVEEPQPEEEHIEEALNAAENENGNQDDEGEPEEEEEVEEDDGDGEEAEGDEDAEEQQEHQQYEENEEDEQEPLEKLLEPFGKDQLASLVKDAVKMYPDFINNVWEMADQDPAHRKIFVHGLGWDTTADILKSEFSKYGEIEDCKAVMDRVSGKSKGYAFILFKKRSGARKALREPQKKIGNRMTSCQLASTGPVPAPPPTAPPVSEYTQRKIFVSNVSAEVEPQKLLEYFKQFGEVEEGPLGLDKHTGKPKGFALFVYKSVESAKRALEEPHKNFQGLTLHCQKAIDGPKPGKQGFGGGGGGSGQQFHQQQQHAGHYHHSKKGKYSSAATSSAPGHLMAPSGPPVGYNPGVAAPALNPALGQALTALLASPGLGLGNLLAPVNPGAPPAAYANQAGYGGQPPMPGGYQNPQMGQTGGVRPQQGGGAPYMGH